MINNQQFTTATRSATILMPDPQPSPELTAQLAAALRHPNPNVRAGAALALGRLKAADQLDHLIAALADPVFAVHSNAARAVGMFGVPAVGALLALLEDRTPTLAPERIADAFSHINDPAAADILSAALNYLQPPARHGVADALGRIGDPRAVPALMQTARAGDPVSRQRAAQALLRTADPQALHTFSALLAEDDARLRQLGAEGLGALGGQETVPTLLALAADPDENVRLAAAAALARAATPASLDLLRTSLASPNAFVQRTVLEVMGSLGDPAAAPTLYAIANSDGDLQTRITAAQSLLNLGDSRGAQMILRTLNAPNTETRRFAAIALGLAGDPRAITPLLDAVNPRGLDPATSAGRLLRRRIVSALQRVGAPALPQLIETLGSADAPRRAVASDVLAALGAAAVPALADALQTHANVLVRAQAAQLLGRIGDERAVEPLTNVLRTTLIGPFPVVYFARLFVDVTAKVRAASAEALGRLEQLDGASILLSSARFDPDHTVRAAAQRALAHMGAPMTIARFAQLDVAGFVNRAAAGGLALALAGFAAGTVSQLWGIPEVALLSGLAAGGALGFADGLEGRREPIRAALLGGLLAAVLAGAAGLLGGRSWLVSAFGAAIPAAAGLRYAGRVDFLQRAAGLFGGMVLGFVGAGLAAVLLGTID